MLLQFMGDHTPARPLWLLLLPTIPDSSIAMGYSDPGSVMLGTKDEQRAGR